MALGFYRGNVEETGGAVPIILLVGEQMLPVILDLPDDDSAEAVAPALIRRMLPAVTEETGPLTQALLSVEVELLNVNRPFAGKYLGVAVYSAGADEYRLIAPFRRDKEGVVSWREEDTECIIGPNLDKDDVILALRWLVEQSR